MRPQSSFSTVKDLIESSPFFLSTSSKHLTFLWSLEELNFHFDCFCESLLNHSMQVNPNYEFSIQYPVTSVSITLICPTLSLAITKIMNLYSFEAQFSTFSNLLGI